MKKWRKRQILITKILSRGVVKIQNEITKNQHITAQKKTLNPNPNLNFCLGE
eukprot:c45640_g1_i1 orf=191-346(+)